MWRRWHLHTQEAKAELQAVREKATANSQVSSWQAETFLQRLQREWHLHPQQEKISMQGV